ncbi:hypothetical protein ACFL0L_05020 [Patescibacteria group bacterium]
MPPGQTKGEYTDGSNFFVVCRDKPADFGNVCSDGTECEYDCMVSEETVTASGCVVESLLWTDCPGVTGQCNGSSVQGIIIIDGQITRTALY